MSEFHQINLEDKRSFSYCFSKCFTINYITPCKVGQLYCCSYMLMGVSNTFLFKANVLLAANWGSIIYNE